MLLQRVLSSMILIPTVLVAAWLGGIPFAVLVAAAAGIGAFEFLRMAHGTARRHYVWLGVVGAILLAFSGLNEMVNRALLPVLLLIVSASVILDKNSKLDDWWLTLSGILYPALLLSLAIPLRNAPDGLFWVLVTAFGTWACDTAAYGFGRAFGRRGFFTHISPKKTWEGTIGGVLTCTLVTLLMFYLQHLSLLEGVGLGILIGLAVVLGDLTESMMKRGFGVKDSGSFLPGHGGLLDRIDGLVFAFAVVFVYVAWVRFSLG